MTTTLTLANMADNLLNSAIEQATVWGPKLLLAILTFWIGWKIAGWAGRIIGREIDKRDIDPTLKPFLISVISSLIKVAVVVTAISTAGVEASSFAAILASMGLAIGLALSGTLQNFAGGVILLIIRPFKVGDVITVQGFTGKVKEIQIFLTTIVTGDNKLIMIPNGKLQNDSITNLSALPERRVDFSFCIGYEDDIKQAKEVILGVIAKCELAMEIPEPTVTVGELADSSVNLTTRVWCETSEYWNVHFHINEEVKFALDAAGISIPYPQSDVHMLEKKA